MTDKMKVPGIVVGGDKAKLMGRAAEALRGSNLTAIFEAAGMTDINGTANSALKAVLAERAAEYAIRAMRVARKKKLALGAAAIIIAAQTK